MIVADPSPRTVYGPDRNDKLLARTLAELDTEESETDLLRSRRREFKSLGDSLAGDDPRRLEASEREEDLIREQADHLLGVVSRGCAGAPCALFLVSDGYWENPRSHFLGRERIEKTETESKATMAAREVSRTLAAYEWIGISLPIREGDLEVKAAGAQGTDFDRFIDAAGGVQRAPRAKDKPFELGLEALEVSAMPQLQPLRKIGLESVGGVIRVVSQVEAAMQRLENLWRVSYLTDRALDGALRTMALRLDTSGATLPTAAWVRSSTPESVANLRLRSLLDGGTTRGELELHVDVDVTTGSSETSIEIGTDWGELAELVSKREVRVSVGYLSPSGEHWIGHSVFTSPEFAGTEWSHEVVMEIPSTASRLVVAVEGLVPRLWGASTVEM